MQIAVLTFDGFNELDSFVAAAILGRMKAHGWAAHITSPTKEVTSMNGVTVRRQKPLEFSAGADAVLIGSGTKSRDIAADAELLSRIKLDPSRQLIGAQCSGTLLLAKLGLIGDLSACTDLTTKPWLIEAGVNVIDAPFVAHGNVATAGGCLSSQYLATWMIARGASMRYAEEAMHYVAPVGEKALYVEQAVSVVTPFIARESAVTIVPTAIAPNSPESVRPDIDLNAERIGMSLDGRTFAKQWEHGWNSHDLEMIMSHYRDDIVFRSRKAIPLVGVGEIHGIHELRKYWAAALERQPALRFTVQNVFEGHEMLVISYLNHQGVLAMETLYFDMDGLIYQAAACHRSV